MSHTIASALVEYKSIKMNNDFADDTIYSRALSHARTAQDLLDCESPDAIREYLDITRSILNDLEKRMNEALSGMELETREDVLMQSAINKYNAKQQQDVATKQQEPAPEVVVEPAPKAKRVKRSKQVDTIVENVKGKRDVNAGDKARIDQAKAQDVKPAKVAQEKRTTKKAAAEKAKKEKRTHNGMSYAETRKQVSERKAKLNKADQERMAKAGLKNNTWDGAIESLAWLDKYFPAK